MMALPDGQEPLIDARKYARRSFKLGPFRLILFKGYGQVTVTLDAPYVTLEVDAYKPLIYADAEVSVGLTSLGDDVPGWLRKRRLGRFIPVPTLHAYLALFGVSASLTALPGPSGC